MQTYKAMNTDIAKLRSRIADRQERARQEAARGDREMARMYQKDVTDLTDALNFIVAGDYESAWSIIDWIDTVVREEVPVRLYNFIAKEIGAC
jgi:hypothetical protein